MQRAASVSAKQIYKPLVWVGGAFGIAGVFWFAQQARNRRAASAATRLERSSSVRSVVPAETAPPIKQKVDVSEFQLPLEYESGAHFDWRVAPYSNESLMSQTVTAATYNELKDEKTSQAGWTLKQAMRPGVELPSTKIGLYAGDADSYWRFQAVFFPIIRACQHGYDPLTREHRSDMNESKIFHQLKDEKLAEYLLSIRMRAARNISGLNLVPAQTKQQLEEVESIAKNCFKKFPAGTYTSYSQIEEGETSSLLEARVLFPKDDPFLKTTGAGKTWPTGRGVFRTTDDSLICWVGEEDSMKLISMERGTDFAGAFARLVRGIKLLEIGLQEQNKNFEFDKNLGYINTCPANLGTGLRVSVHLKLPILSKQPTFEKACGILGLEVRRFESDPGVVEVSNKFQLGYTEVELVNTVIRGVENLILMEEDFAAKPVGEHDVGQLQSFPLCHILPVCVHNTLCVCV
ncbi:MAG: hypothetical protein MHM6MM_008722, partial [Cercozoa sp. M6MM]